MTEPVFLDAVVVFTPPAFYWVASCYTLVTCEYVGHLMSSLHIERCFSLALTLASSLGCQSGVVVCGPLFVVMRHCMPALCNTFSVMPQCNASV